MGTRKKWLIRTSALSMCVLCAGAIAHLYVKYSFNISLLSFVVHPVFKQSTLPQEDRYFRSIKLIQSDKQIATRSFGGSIEIWDARTLEQKRVLTDPILDGALDIDRKRSTLAAAGSAQVIQVLDAQTGKPRPILLGPNSMVNDFAIRSDGSQLLVPQWNLETQKWQISFLNAYTGKIERSIESKLRPEKSLDQIRHIALDSAGKLLAIASSNFIETWDLESDRILHTVEIKNDAVVPAGRVIKALVFSADSQRLTVEQNFGQLQQIDTRTGKVLRHIDIERQRCLSPIAISPSGDRAACTHPTKNKTSSVVVIDIKSGETIAKIDGQIDGQTDSQTDGQTASVDNAKAFSANSEEILVNETGGHFLYNIETGRSVFSIKDQQEDQPDKQSVFATFSDNRELILVKSSRSKDGLDYSSIAVINASDQQLIKEFDLSKLSNPEQGRLSGDTVVVQNNKQKVLNLWDVYPDRLKQKHSVFLENIWHIEQVSLSPDGKSFAIQDRDLSFENRAAIHIGEVASGQIVHRLESDGREIESIKFSADGTKIVAIYVIVPKRESGDSKKLLVEIIDVGTGRTMQKIEPSMPSAATIREKGESVTLSPDATLSEDGSLLATVSRYRVQLWDVETGKLLKTLSQDRGWSRPGSFVQATDVPRVAISQDNQWAAFVGYDRRLSIWDLDTGDRLRTLPFKSGLSQTYELAFSRDRKTLVGISDQQIFRWRLPSRLTR